MTTPMTVGIIVMNTYVDFNVDMGHVARNSVVGVSDQVGHKLAVQPQKIARALKFRI